MVTENTTCPECLKQKVVQETPADRDPYMADAIVGAILGFVAFGTVGAVRAWLEDGRRRDPSTFLALDQALLPAWWSAPAGPS